jgi:hypothetical protein
MDSEITTIVTYEYEYILYRLLPHISHRICFSPASHMSRNTAVQLSNRHSGKQDACVPTVRLLAR